MDHYLAPDFRAQLTFLTEEEGGRNTPLGNSHRAIIHFDDRDEQSPAEFRYHDREDIYPGDMTNCDIVIIRHDHLTGEFYAGKDFSILEHDKAIGTGVIVEVYPTDD